MHCALHMIDVEHVKSQICYIKVPLTFFMVSELFMNMTEWLATLTNKIVGMCSYC